MDNSFQSGVVNGLVIQPTHNNKCILSWKKISKFFGVVDPFLFY